MSSALTLSKDGKKRLNFSISYRMELDELAVYITARGCDLAEPEWKPFGAEPNAKAIRSSLSSKAKALEFARDGIDRHGTEIPHYRVGDENLNDVKEIVLGRLKELWEVSE